MKTLVGILTVFFIVAVTGQVDAQQGKRGSCINAISNLTEQQKTSINELNETFQKQMADYRAERQATNDQVVKSAVREKMLSARAEHLKSVNALLTPEQQKEYADWQDARQATQRAKQQGNGNGNGRGKGKNRGNSNGSGNGQGTGMQQGNKGATNCTGTYRQAGNGCGAGICRWNS